MTEHDKAARLVARTLSEMGGTLASGVSVAVIGSYMSPDLIAEIEVGLFKDHKAVNHFMLCVDPFGGERPRIKVLPL